MDNSCGVLEITDEWVSVLASQWVDPIADVAWFWYSYSQLRSDLEHLTPADFGRIHAIVLLLVVMLESYSQCAAIDSEFGGRVRSKQFEIADWWSSTTYRNKESVLDVIEVRNIIAHNHLYSYSGDSVDRHDSDFTLLSKQTVKLQRRLEGNRFAVTGLPCIPVVIGPEDVKRIAVIVRDALQFLHQSGARIGPVSFSIPRGGAMRTVWDWITLSADSALQRTQAKKT